MHEVFSVPSSPVHEARPKPVRAPSETRQDVLGMSNRRSRFLYLPLEKVSGSLGRSRAFFFVCQVLLGSTCACYNLLLQVYCTLTSCIMHTSMYEPFRIARHEVC